VLPLGDRLPLRRIRFAWVNLSVIGACTLVFLWQVGLPPREAARAVYAYGSIPSVLFGIHELSPQIGAVSAPLALVTSMFLHGGWMHLLGNMLYLWIFGDNVEDSMGHGRYAAFYLLAGIVAGLGQALAMPDSVLPSIGASGAISGVLGAYLVLHPRAPVKVMVFFPLFLTLPAWIVLGSWIGLQFLNASMDQGGTNGGVAWFAHIGGFVAGAVLIAVFRHRDVPLFGGLQSAREVGRAMVARPGRSRIPDAGGSWRRRDE
jgi:membrane associated rhomboid family serine protease